MFPREIEKVSKKLGIPPQKYRSVSDIPTDMISDLIQEIEEDENIEKIEMTGKEIVISFPYLSLSSPLSNKPNFKRNFRK